MSARTTRTRTRKRRGYLRRSAGELGWVLVEFVLELIGSILVGLTENA